jgi:rubrerythrin
VRKSPIKKQGGKIIMASNVVKKLQIELDGHSVADLAGLIEEKVIEKIQELIETECSELSNMGEDGNTELSLEDTDVSITGDGLEADIYFNRESGKFAATSDVEDEVIRLLQNQDIEITFNFSLVI